VNMKEFDFSYAYRRFDGFNRFYASPTAGFIEFETGELIYTRGAPDPDDRHMYERYGIQIVASTDTEMPRLIVNIKGEEREIPKAWVSHKGIQYFALDHTKKLAVGIGRLTEQDLNQLPRNMHNAKIFWASHRAKPVGGPVRFWQPADLTEQEHDYVAVLKKMAKAMCALEGYGYSRVQGAACTPKWLREFMAKNPDPTQAMQTLSHDVARAMVYSPTQWLDRDEIAVKYATF